ncbi:MAG TPA: hypothetical protein VHV78_09725, partial [Gemmatimonadaceae bacterium]|nr:hypothetical protein [Gemmatimonadaceae bacterium]
MNPRDAARVVALCIVALSVVPGNASGQVPRALTLVPDERIDLAKLGGAREMLMGVGPQGNIVLVPRGGWSGAAMAFDSSGAPLPWKLVVGGGKLMIGGGNDADVGVADRLGWIGGTTAMWISDPMYRQIAVVDEHGTVTKSIERPSWIHPSWSDRRRYPLFASSDPLAVYADETMLVSPGHQRSIISTPTYDASLTHMLRTTVSGSIRRTVATVPADDRQVDVHVQRVGGRGPGRPFFLPFYARPVSSVSPDGMRIAVASYGVTTADSGTVGVTMLTD